MYVVWTMKKALESFCNKKLYLLKEKRYEDFVYINEYEWINHWCFKNPYL